VKEAGGRVRMDSFYKNSAPERMAKAWKEGDYVKAARLSLPALLEYARSRSWSTSSRCRSSASSATGEEGARGAAAGRDARRSPRRAAKAWDSVDNRMGQLVYDNLFWSKTFKDLAMASVRSVGWNLGTIRELGGGLVDLASEGAKAATQGRSPPS
jgi:hypothetical protein